MDFFERIKISEADSLEIEKQTILQSHCVKWHDIRKERITSSNAHKVITRKRNFESLAYQLLNPKSESELPQMVQDAFKHGGEYEPVARRQYEEYLKYNLRHDVSVRETGIVVQPHLFWLAASPDGLVADKTGDAIGLIEIKCPKSKKKAPQKNWSMMISFIFLLWMVNQSSKKIILMVTTHRSKWQWDYLVLHFVIS